MKQLNYNNFTTTGGEKTKNEEDKTEDSDEIKTGFVQLVQLFKDNEMVASFPEVGDAREPWPKFIEIPFDKHIKDATILGVDTSTLQLTYDSSEETDAEMRRTIVIMIMKPLFSLLCILIL